MFKMIQLIVMVILWGTVSSPGKAASITGRSLRCTMPEDSSQELQIIPARKGGFTVQMVILDDQGRLLAAESLIKSATCEPSDLARDFNYNCHGVNDQIHKVHDGSFIRLQAHGETVTVELNNDQGESEWKIPTSNCRAGAESR